MMGERKIQGAAFDRPKPSCTARGGPAVILVFVLLGSALIGGAFGWYRGTTLMRFPTQYFSPPKNMEYEQWLMELDWRLRRQRWMKTAIYAAAGPVAGFVVLSLFAVR
jgi:hypothetical protein